MHASRKLNTSLKPTCIPCCGLMPLVERPMRGFLSSCVVLFFLMAAVLVVGCSDPYAGRMEVTGDVKLVGEPIQDGTIEFKPVEKQNADTHSGAPIKNGAYTVPRKNGLKPGKYLVIISSGSG